MNLIATNFDRLVERRSGLSGEHAELTKKLGESTKRDILFSELQSTLHWVEDWRVLTGEQKNKLRAIASQLGGFIPRLIDGFCEPIDVSKVVDPVKAARRREEMEDDHSDCFGFVKHVLVREHQLTEGARRSRIQAGCKALGKVSGRIGRMLNKASRVGARQLSDAAFMRPGELGAKHRTEGKIRVSKESTGTKKRGGPRPKQDLPALPKK